MSTSTAVIRTLLAVWGLPLVACANPGCDTWIPPAPTAEELARGLVVLYPGSTNTRTEMQGFYIGLRDAHVNQAIEVVPWSLPLEHFFNPSGFVEQNRPWAAAEAARIVAYQDAHPGAPVTLLGFSGGSMTAIMVTESMPAGRGVDCVIMLTPAVSRHYDLAHMLDRVTGGAIVYWSPRDQIADALVEALGTVDGAFSDAAATYGFASTDDRLTQIAWDPSMAAAYGQNGDHLDFFWNIAWIRDYVGPWVKHQ